EGRRHGALRSHLSHSRPIYLSSGSLQHVCHALFFFNDTAPTEISTLSLHDALPISRSGALGRARRASRRHRAAVAGVREPGHVRSEEHTSELQSRGHLVCRLLLEKKKK